MGGWLTNGLPTVQPLVENGVPVQISNMNNNGTVVNGGLAPAYTQLQADDLFPADTGAPGGEVPQSVAATAFQIAAHAAALITNTGSSTAGTATLNTVEGLITTESLTTAAGATYSFALVDSLISATSPIPQVAFLKGTDTVGEAQINSITNSAGTATIVVQNVGTAAFNGKWLLAFHL